MWDQIIKRIAYRVCSPDKEDTQSPIRLIAKEPKKIQRLQ